MVQEIMDLGHVYGDACIELARRCPTKTKRWRDAVAAHHVAHDALEAAVAARCEETARLRAEGVAMRLDAIEEGDLTHTPYTAMFARDTDLCGRRDAISREIHRRAIEGWDDPPPPTERNAP